MAPFKGALPMKFRLIVLLAIGLSAGGIARAGNRDAEAKEHYEEGTKAFNLGEFKRAIEEYRKAYQAKPEPVLLYDIAQSYRLSNDLTNAVFFYRSYLRNSPNASNRREIDERIRKLEAQLQEQHQVTTQPPNTPVPIGSQPARETPPETPLPAEATPKAPPPTLASIPPPQSTASSATQPAPASPALQLTQSGAPPRERTPVYKKWWLWTAVGAVVVVGVGVGVGIALTSGAAPSTHLGTTGVF